MVNNGIQWKNDGFIGFYGGVVGLWIQTHWLNYHYNLGTVENIIGTEDECHAGGVAGFVAENSSIKRSFSNSLLFKKQKTLVELQE